MTKISNNGTIAKNTIFLYFRMMFTMIVSLYTSRINLNVLGIEDNGIYQVVGGVVAMFAFLNGSLSGATSRFLTYELGKGDKQKLKDTFSSALNIHIIVAFIIFILSETIGVWFLENKLVIPESRMYAARIVFQVSVLSSMIAVTQVPYNATIIAHEKMNVFAYMSILDVILKLLICYLLYIVPWDKLISFGVLMLVVTTISQLVYRQYCIKHFKGCRFSLVKDMSIVKPMLSFTTWDLFGNFSVMARGQGVNIILNMFFGPVINAASGFATTVGQSVYGFANNFMTAIRPPIVKAYSIGDYAKMESLMIHASKYSFCLLLLFSSPFLFESKYILDIWLKTPPEYTDIFCVLELILSLCSTLFIPLMFAIHATGRIRLMSILNGTIWFMVVPITYVMLYLGADPVTPYIIKIGLLLFVVLANIYSIKRSIPTFRVSLYLRKTVLPCVIMGIIVLVITYVVHSSIKDNSLLRFLSTCTISTLSIISCAYFIILTEEHRKKVLKKLSAIIKYK